MFSLSWFIIFISYLGEHYSEQKQRAQGQERSRSRWGALGSARSDVTRIRRNGFCKSRWPHWRGSLHCSRRQKSDEEIERFQRFFGSRSGNQDPAWGSSCESNRVRLGLPDARIWRALKRLIFKISACRISFPHLVNSARNCLINRHFKSWYYVTLLYSIVNKILHSPYDFLLRLLL